jgi:hypothetical protein
MEQDRRERTSNSKIKELWIWRPEEFTEVESFFFNLVVKRIASILQYQVTI